MLQNASEFKTRLMCHLCLKRFNIRWHEEREGLVFAPCVTLCNIEMHNVTQQRRADVDLYNIANTSSSAKKEGVCLICDIYIT